MEYILIALCVGAIPGFIAQSKGRNFVSWWLYGAALLIVALPHSLIISKDAQSIEREQLQSGGSKKCPFCAEIIKAEAIVCRFCGRDLPAMKTVQEQASDDLATLAVEYGLVKAEDSEDHGETWWAPNDVRPQSLEDHNLFITIDKGSWSIRSRDAEVAERIRRIRGHLSVDDSQEIKPADHGIRGSGLEKLATALRTYRSLLLSS